jgi:cell shape-determining protein MreC
MPEEVDTVFQTSYEAEFLPIVNELKETKTELEQERQANAELLAENLRLKKALGEAKIA